MTDSVRSERRDSVLVVSINRPQARNAIHFEASTKIAELMTELDEDPSLRAAVLRGEGEWFSAGMDLKRFAQGEIPHVEGRGFGGLTESPPAKPLIAAVEGGALAGGFEMVLACDLVVAAQGSRFGLPEVKRGLVAAGGGLLRLPRRVPRNAAMELILTGSVIDAERAHALGLVNRLVAPGQTLTEALRMAEAIAGNGPLAVREAKRVVKESAQWAARDAFDRQHEIADRVTKSADAQEGAAAFIEKREPRWSGR